MHREDAAPTAIGFSPGGSSPSLCISLAYISGRAGAEGGREKTAAQEGTCTPWLLDTHYYTAALSWGSYCSALQGQVGPHQFSIRPHDGRVETQCLTCNLQGDPLAENWLKPHRCVMSPFLRARESGGGYVNLPGSRCCGRSPPACAELTPGVAAFDLRSLVTRRAIGGLVFYVLSLQTVLKQRDVCLRGRSICRMLDPLPPILLFCVCSSINTPPNPFLQCMCVMDAAARKGLTLVVQRASSGVLCPCRLLDSFSPPHPVPSQQGEIPPNCPHCPFRKTGSGTRRPRRDYTHTHTQSYVH